MQAWPIENKRYNPVCIINMLELTIMSSLAKKTLSNTLLFFLGLALLIFLPSMTLNFWQGWVYLSVFYICVVLITIYFLKTDPKLMESRLKAGPTAEKEIEQKKIQTFTAICLLLLFVSCGLNQLYQWNSLNPIINLFANLFLIVGFAIVFLTFKINSHTSAVIEVDKNQKVISTGVYSLVRHPMYLGAVLILVATPLALNSLYSLFFSFAGIYGVILRLIAEEKYLTKNLSGYQGFCKKTRYHLIPFVW